MAITSGQTALASDFVSTSAGAGDSGKVPKLNASGVLDPTFFDFEFGDGSDGDVTISAGTTTLTKDMFYNSLVVTGTLVTDGFRVFVKGQLSGAGTIKWGTPNNGGNGGIGSGGTAGASSGTGPLKTRAGVAGPVGDGSNGITGLAGNIGSNGTSGGSGGGSGFGSGGTGGTKANTWGCLQKLTFIASTGLNLKSDNTYEPLANSTGGSGGNGQGSSNDRWGGGSGASGGTMIIWAQTWAGTFTIQSNGGNGGNGGNGAGNPSGGGGAGGNGGVVFVVYKTKTWSGSYNLTGGTGGLAGTSSSGSAATDGSAGATGLYYEIPSSRLI
jgi:hypothetical protein